MCLAYLHYLLYYPLCLHHHQPRLPVLLPVLLPLHLLLPVPALLQLHRYTTELL
jgi:uncharacterized membrane protein